MSLWQEEFEEALLYRAEISSSTQEELTKRGVDLTELLVSSQSKQIRELFLLGWLVEEIAELYELREEDIVNETKSMSPDTHELLDRHAAGQTPVEIAKETRFSRAWVYKVLNRRNLTPHISSTRAREITVRQQETVIKMLDEGKRVQDIAARLKISDNQVRHVKYKLERYG